MSGLTKEQYEKQAAQCEGLCEVPVTHAQEVASELPCVTCPFCREIVTARLTPITISCPACKITVSR